MVRMATLSAQDVKVWVKNDNGEPVPHAYVYVNGRVVGVVDTLGVTAISEENLQIGDTLSASMVGAKSEWVIYQRQNRIELLLENAITARSVFVYADAENFFSKNLNDIRPICYAGTLTADFRMKINQPGSEARVLAGSLQVDNESYGKNLVRPMGGQLFFGDSIRFLTQSDTIGVYSMLDDYIHWALDASGGLTGACMTTKRARTLIRREGYGFRFGLLGKEDGMVRFRVSFSPETTASDTYQQLLYIDENRKSLTKAEVSILHLSNSKINGTYNISANYIDYSYKNRAPTLMPINIHYVYKADSGLLIDIIITNATFKTRDLNTKPSK